MISMRTFGLVALMTTMAAVNAQSNVPDGTEVNLRFEQALSSRTAKAGDTVRFTVANNVVVGGKTVLATGTPVTGVIEAVSKRDHFGKNARIRLVLNPVHGIHLDPRDKGKPFSGSKTDKAAMASGAGALLLGPVGLAGGYFFTGKSVMIKAGDMLRTEVSAPMGR
jgi:hypothetical protein